MVWTALAIGGLAGDEPPDRSGFDCLAVVNAVRGERDIAEALTFVELDELGSDGWVYLKFAYCACQSWPCWWSSRTRSRSFGSPVRL